jgi:septum formation protein
MNTLILASSSPRRKELLEKAGFRFQVIPVKVSETLDKNLTLDAQIQDLARRKAQALVESANLPKGQSFLILSADTVVVLGATVFGKPESVAEAEEFLSRLSGQTHLVKTAICLWNYDQDRVVTAIDTAEVTFHELPLNTIRQYVATGDSMDKAGAYGIQSQGRLFVKDLVGSFDNVMGLPIALVERLLKENDWHIARTKS